ncbi:MAG: hypothetical protein N2450_04065 [bacterium]|nr:hypothetical protein [bacterium]
MNVRPRTSRTFQFQWPPLLGFCIGLFFVILGIVFTSGLIRIGWWGIEKVRWIVGITIILLGLLRMVQFYPDLLKKRRKSLREKLESINESKK